MKSDWVKVTISSKGIFLNNIDITGRFRSYCFTYLAAVLLTRIYVTIINRSLEQQI